MAHLLSSMQFPQHMPGQTWSSRPAVDFVEYPGASSSSHDPVSHTQQPIMTGTSVLGLKYDGGVMLAADNLASYGSLARFDDIQRLHPVGSHTCVGASGDMSDYQQLQHMLDSITVKQAQIDDGHALRTSQVFEYLTRVMYNRRSKMNPLWNSLLVAGWEESATGTGAPFLSYVDLQGATYSAPSIATGYGSMIALPLMRKAQESAANGLLSESEAEELLKTCMKVLFYRDARSLNKFQIAKIDKSGVRISDSMSVPTEWGSQKACVDTVRKQSELLYTRRCTLEQILWLLLPASHTLMLRAHQSPVLLAGPVICDCFAALDSLDG